MVWPFPPGVPVILTAVPAAIAVADGGMSAYLSNNMWVAVQLCREVDLLWCWDYWETFTSLSFLPPNHVSRAATCPVSNKRELSSNRPLFCLAADLSQYVTIFLFLVTCCFSETRHSLCFTSILFEVSLHGLQCVPHFFSSLVVPFAIISFCSCWVRPGGVAFWIVIGFIAFVILVRFYSLFTQQGHVLVPLVRRPLGPRIGRVACINAH